VSENSFEMLFREAPELTARLPRYVESVAAALPFAEGAGEALADACARNSRFARRLRSIHERGHLQGVTLDRLRHEITRHGLREEDYVRDGHLVADNPEMLLRILNEDLFTGGLSDTQYQAERKTART